MAIAQTASGVIPPEKPLTPAQRLRKVRLFRRMMRLLTPIQAGTWRRVRGEEWFLDTCAGRVRVLTYGLDRPETLPLFIDIHGGGFVMGRPEMDDRHLPGVAAAANVKIISVDYSLAPEAPFPAALEECYAVAVYAREHAAELRIDPERIAMGGHSAGGNLSAAVCLLDRERREVGLAALILDYPPLDLCTDPFLKPLPNKTIPPQMARVFDACYAGPRDTARNVLISPLYATVDEVRHFPPTLVITASEDSLAPEAEAFKDKLVEAGVDVTFRRFQGVPHGFTHLRVPEAAEAWGLMGEFLARKLGRGAQREEREIEDAVAAGLADMDPREAFHGFLRSRGQNLGAWHGEEVGLTMTDAEQALDLAMASGQVVLGGDIYCRWGEDVVPAYLNWAFEATLGEETDTLLIRSRDESKRFLSQLPVEPEGCEYLVVIVAADPPWVIAHVYTSELAPKSH